MNAVEMPPVASTPKKSLEEFNGIGVTVHLRGAKDSMLAGTLLQSDATGAWVARGDALCFVPFTSIAYIALPDKKR
jgi:hypothetical protein